MGKLVEKNTALNLGSFPDSPTHTSATKTMKGNLQKPEKNISDHFCSVFGLSTFVFLLATSDFEPPLGEEKPI